MPAPKPTDEKYTFDIVVSRGMFRIGTYPRAIFLNKRMAKKGDRNGFTRRC